MNFYGLENNKIIYECKEYKGIWLIPINRLIKKFSLVNQFCNGDNKEVYFVVKKRCLSI